VLHLPVALLSTEGENLGQVGLGDQVHFAQAAERPPLWPRSPFASGPKDGSGDGGVGHRPPAGPPENGEVGHEIAGSPVGIVQACPDGPVSHDPEDAGGDEGARSSLAPRTRGRV
jgi:hypothetical protein